MARSKASAADYLEQFDPEMRIILGELVENAGKVNMLWTFARNTSRVDPNHALTLLIDAEILLNHHVKIERSDSLRRIRAAISRLGEELPDHDETSGLGVASSDINER
jgi:hypothetical protein